MSKNYYRYSPLDGNEDFVKTHTKKEIAEHFGVSYNHVLNWIKRKGNGIKSLSERLEKNSYISDDFVDYAKNHTVSQTAKNFDISYSCAYNAIRNLNITPVFSKRKSYSEDTQHKHTMKRTGEAHDMICELSKTFSISSIARVFGYSKERIRQICIENGCNISSESDWEGFHKL